MPQLDPASFVSQLFWLTVCFFALYLVMAKYTLPHVNRVIQSRRERITNDLDKAQRLKEEAEQMASDHDQSLQETRDKASKIIAESVAKATKKAEKEHAKLNESLQKKIQESEAVIEKSKQAALDNLAPISTEMAKLTAEKLTGAKLSSKDVAA